MKTYFYTLTVQMPTRNGFHVSTREGTFTKEDYLTIEELYRTMIASLCRANGYDGVPNVMNFTVMENDIQW